MLVAACSVGREGALPPGGVRCERRALRRRAGFARSRGSVFVANWYGNTVTVYSAGGRSKLRTITTGVGYPNAIAIAKTGTVYVGNYGSPSGSITSNVAVYGANGGQPMRTITQGLLGPYAIAFGPTGKVYVANFGGPTVTVYGKRSIVGAPDDIDRGAISGGARLRSSRQSLRR